MKFSCFFTGKQAVKVMEAPEDQHSMSEYGGRRNKYTSILSKSMLFQAFTVNAHVSTCSFLVRL